MAERYDFGRNWSEFSATITSESIEFAEQALVRLVGDLNGKTFFDIGCGSGLHSLAAVRLGAARVVAIDYDPESVETTRRLLSAHADSNAWHAYRDDILKMAAPPDEKFDIVYSWGVLHHTGKMWNAIDHAIAFVKPNGILAVGLYRKTPFCGIWKQEKRLYARHRFLRPAIRKLFVAAMLFAHFLRGRDPRKVVTNYGVPRGMSFMHDVDDWLGGYPYESVVPEDLEASLSDRSFALVRRFNTQKRLGLFGTGCGEWVFRRIVD